MSVVRQLKVVLCVALLLMTCTKTISAQIFPGPIFNGDAAGDQLGISCAGAGDVNGDGFADVIVGARGNDTNGIDAGLARVISGADNAVLYTLLGDSASQVFGSVVAGAGDVNADGFSDFVVGGFGDSTNGTSAGMARVFSGIDGTTLYTFFGDSAFDVFGLYVTGGGDVDGDGFDDIMVGASGDDNNGTDSGSVRVYSGADGSTIYSFDGDSAGDLLGYGLDIVGDVNNDGYDDMIIGAYLNDNNGADSGNAKVYSGFDGSILYSFNGDSANDHFGRSVAAAGDVNNDGFADFVVGAYLDDDNGSASGSLRVFSGFDGAILYTFYGDSSGDLFGWFVDGAGDVDGDGFDDIAATAPLDDDNGSNSGSARVFSGIDGSIIATVFGDSAGDNFGFQVSGAGDVNGDGRDDLIVGANADDNNGTTSGSARIFIALPPPVFPYTSPFAVTALQLTWTPDGGNIKSPTGTIDCFGATPGGLGMTGTSLAPTSVFAFGLTLLIDVSPMSLIMSGGFGFDITGSITVPAVSRQNAFLAGIYVYVQFYEIAPFQRSSNGLAMLVVP